MTDRNRPMEFHADVDVCGVDAATAAQAMECMRKEQEIATAFAVVLQKHFPGYPWEIKVEAERAAAMVRLPIMPPNVYFIIPFAKFMGSVNGVNDWGKFAGGELLERFNLSRNGINLSEFSDARPKPKLIAADPAESGPNPKLILN